jgi:tripartite ATP-independent transporter DctM subunit
MALMFFWFFLISMVIGLPIVFGMLIGPGMQLLIEGKVKFLTLLMQRLYNGIDSFPLMALPFFVLAGELMNQGGITGSLVRFSQAIIGHFRGGLAHVNILSSILFAGLSGSAVADTSALGAMLIPAMEKNGYTKRFAAAVTAASSVIGPIIPPSGLMILYAFVMNVSVGALFAAGIVPGLLVGFSLMAITVYLSKKRDYPVASRRATFKEFVAATRAGFLPLLTPIIMLGGILTGVFTPTEAAAVAVGYALILTLFITRTLKFKELGKIFKTTAINSGVILLLVGAAVAFSSFVSLSQTPQAITKGFLAISSNKYVVLLLINVLLLIVGMFLDAGPAILILGPILAPAMVSLGVHPVHFAIIMCVNVTIGLATPPMGLVLFVASSLTGDRVEKIALEMAPFLLMELVVILLITFVEPLSMTIPRWLGFVQ